MDAKYFVKYIEKEDCELFKLKNVWSYITKISIDKLDVSVNSH